MNTDEDFRQESMGPKDRASCVALEHDRRMGRAVIDAAGLQQLVSTLIDRGYSVVGPTLSVNAIVLAELTSADDLPKGWDVDVGCAAATTARFSADRRRGPGARTDHPLYRNYLCDDDRWPRSRDLSP